MSAAIDAPIDASPFFTFCKCSKEIGVSCLTVIYNIAVKDMAANLERKWRNQFVYMQDQVMAVEDDIQGGFCYQPFVISSLK
jgi:hypothetical protein